MKILLATISARGHAIADAISRSSRNHEIIHICPSANPGIRALSMEQYVIGSLLDFDSILAIAEKTKPDFAFIAPEDPIGKGLVDALEADGFPCIAPRKSLARIESSKGFTRELMMKYGIDASPRFRVFHAEDTDEDIRRYIEQDLAGDFVIKFDGLACGKGVKVSDEHIFSIDEGVAYARECLIHADPDGPHKSQVVIEEKLIGCEFSLMSFVSGERVVSMPAVQDHKRAFIGDTGPNTGGMGTYSDADHSLPFLHPEDIDQAHAINKHVAEALLRECQEPYRGILYGGFIATSSGIKVIEYNARFGDPEALNVLPLLQSDFVDICLSIIDGSLNKKCVQFEKKSTVCIYITPDSYPESKKRMGEKVTFPTSIPENARIYYGDISADSCGAFHLGGSRTAGVVGIADTIEEARNIALSVCKEVRGPVRMREDIGSRELLTKRIDLMETLRVSPSHQ